MIRLCILLTGLCFISSCTNPRNEHKNPITIKTDYFPVDYNYAHLQGTYQGDFGGSSIFVILRYVSGRYAVGFDTHKGLRRNISGIMEPTSGGFHFNLAEPGDNIHDGRFDFTLDTTTLKIKGIWYPNAVNGGEKLSKTYTLKPYSKDTAALEMGAGIYSDSLGTIEFGADGLCTYRYYPGTKGQLMVVNGSWTLTNHVYNIDWQSNDAFPSRHSQLTQKSPNGKNGTEYYGVQLIGEGRVFTTFEF